MIKIVSVGDIMPGGILNGTTREYVSQEIIDILSDGDIRVGTLETAIGNEPEFNVEKMNRLCDVIYVEDEDSKRLVELNFNVLSLANNHFFDLGLKGAKHTISLLDKLGIKHCGGGINIHEASKPAVVTVNGKTIAFLAFCDWRKQTTGWCPFATEFSPGVNPMYDDYVVAEIKKYRPQYDYIVIIPHWGVEYNISPTIDVYRIGQKMLKAGADLILGGHTHCVQPIINLKNKSLVYSMGNFLFPDRLICPPRSTFYPHPPIDIDKLPTTYGYPYVDEITLKIWKPIGRVGMIVTTTIDERGINSEADYTLLTKDNIILLEDLPVDIKKKLNIVGKLLTFKLYPLIIIMVKCVKLILNVPNIIIRKFNVIY